MTNSGFRDRSKNSTAERSRIPRPPKNFTSRRRFISPRRRMPRANAPRSILRARIQLFPRQMSHLWQCGHENATSRLMSPRFSFAKQIGHSKGTILQLIMRAIANAAAAASPPTTTVCNPPRSGFTPVKWPLIAPKTKSARSVTHTLTQSAGITSFINM